MNDLTIIFLTANEVPEHWAKYHLDFLLKAAEGRQIISISRKPMSLGINLLDNEKKDYGNIYRQMLRGAKIATTKYVAVAEDDTLYSKEHFSCFRPNDDEFAYNRSRWSLFTWDNIYCLRQRISNCSLIAPREILIEALQERFDKYPNNDYPLKYMGECGRNGLEAGLGVKKRKMVEFFSNVPIVQLSHPCGTEERQKIARKKHGQIKAFDIPFYGKAIDIINNYK